MERAHKEERRDIRQTGMRTQIVDFAPGGGPREIVMQSRLQPVLPADGQSLLAFHAPTPLRPVAEVLGEGAADSGARVVPPRPVVRHAIGHAQVMVQ